MNAARRGGGGGRGGGGDGEELEKSVSGELFERGSGGGGLRRVERDKADAVPKATSSCNPQGRRVEQVWPGRSACASSQPG